LLISRRTMTDICFVVCVMFLLQSRTENLQYCLSVSCLWNSFDRNVSALCYVVSVWWVQLALVIDTGFCCSYAEQQCVWYVCIKLGRYRISWPIRRAVIFSLEILEKNNDKCVLILVKYWKKTVLLHTKISNHDVIYSHHRNPENCRHCH